MEEPPCVAESVSYPRAPANLPHVLALYTQQAGSVSLQNQTGLTLYSRLDQLKPETHLETVTETLLFRQS